MTAFKDRRDAAARTGQYVPAAIATAEPASKPFRQYVERGWVLCPIREGEKVPRGRKWNERANGIDQPEHAANLTGAGLMHAFSGTCAIDIDAMDEARAWLRERGIDLTALFSAPDAVQITRGGENRGKLLYALPEPLPTKQIKSDDKTFMLFELRCSATTGNSAQDVLPPTVHPSGKQYEWRGDWRKLPPLPPELHKLWLSLVRPTVERSVAELAPTAHLAELRRLVDQKDPDAAYDEWLKVGQAIHHETQGGDDGLALWDEWSARSSKYPGFDQLAYKWNSFGNAPNPVTAGWLRQGIVATAEDFGPPPTDAQLDEIDAAINGKPAAPTLRVRGHSEAKVEEPTFVLTPLIPRRVVTLLAGHGDAGKSYLSLVITAHVASGQSFAKLPVHQARVLFVSLEDSSNVVWLRLERIAAAYGLDMALIKQHVTVVDVDEAGLDADEGLDSVLVTERNDHGTHRLQFTATFDEVCKHAEGHGLVIIDNASDAYDANENERRLVRRFVRRLQRAIAQRHDAAVLLLAHIDKQGAKLGTMGNTYSGSTSWHNTVRSRLALFTDESDHDQLTLVHEKSNLTRRLDGDIKLVRSGEHSGVPLWLTDQEAEKIATEASSSDDDAVFTAIRRATEAGINVPAATTGTRTAAHVLRGRPELPAAMVKSKNNAKLNEALERLERAGRVTRETYKNEHRKEATRFVVTSRAAPPPRQPTVAELLPPPAGADSDADLL